MRGPQVSRVEFEKIYKRLEVTLTEKGESFYNPFMPDMVKELCDRGLARVADGATVIVSGDKKPLGDITSADIERVLQYYYLNTSLAQHPGLVQCLKDLGLVKENGAGVECLNVGTAKKELLFELAKVSLPTLSVFHCHTARLFNSRTIGPSDYWLKVPLVGAFSLREPTISPPCSTVALSSAALSTASYPHARTFTCTDTHKLSPAGTTLSVALRVMHAHTRPLLSGGGGWG